MHDEVSMPGLQGKDTTAGEVADMAAMFQRHQALRRTVENVPNGIRTVTETDDENLRTALVSHVVQMLARVQTKRHPSGAPFAIETTRCLLFWGNAKN